MTSSIPYNAYTKEPKSTCGNPIKCLANRDNKLLIIMLIWSISDGLSMIWAIFSLQREMNDVTVSSGFYLKASDSLRETSMIALNANYRKNSWFKSSHVRWCNTSKEANQRWAAPLKDLGNSIIIWASSKSWALITYCIVSNEYGGIQSPCIAQSLASRTWSINWPLVLHQNPPR